jgi:energy-coupling factor transporter ATP-binding protein EcfA2
MISRDVCRLRIDDQILVIDRAICGYIDKYGADERGALSQAILQQLRHLTEHIMLKVYAHPNDIENTYDNICKAIDFVKTRGNLKFLRQFHDFLQIVVSHYTLEEESSERLMLKYYGYLLKIKDFLKIKYALDVLGNLNQFPINTDTNLKAYYEKIAEQITHHAPAKGQYPSGDRYYIQKVKPFYVGQKICYEITFTPANGQASKFNRVIAFTHYEIPSYYAVKFALVEGRIQILDKIMPINIIVNWETAVRPCEMNNFARIIGVRLWMQSRSSEYNRLMRYLTSTAFNLVELLDFPDDYYQSVRAQIISNIQAAPFFEVLDRCRDVITSNLPGSNVLRYLLYHLNNKVIKDQLDAENERTSNLHLTNRCLPFDQMPFNSSLPGHNPRLGDLFDCIDATARQHEVLARLVRNNTEFKGNLYTPIRDIAGFEDIPTLMQTYNDALWFGHANRKLVERNGHIFIREYEEDTVAILRKLKELAAEGVANYSNSVVSWLRSNTYNIDSDEKINALIQMFEASTVALIYGSAGTGKSTLINHVSHFFADKDKLYLAQTNPAVDNLKRRVDAAGCTFSTIRKFLMRQIIQTEYDVLFIDECSTVNNRDMRDILNKAKFTLLVLVGDIHQIEAIQFGNWFSAAREFIPDTSVFELTKPYRSDNPYLLDLWHRVRVMDETILELIARQGYSVSLDASIFESAAEDEIILCLNYDGLYGINNINRFLQQSNPQPQVTWGVQLYKVNDPILFNESERFTPLIYNNMKGRIVGIEIIENGNQIQFDLELDKAINGMDARGYDFDLLGTAQSGNSVIRFQVNKYKSTDADDDASVSDVVPFQVAYAVSVHKAQGLEYSSVKIVITDEIDELITHNIFYTAITRARKRLRIYWTPEVERKVLSQIKPKQNGRDVALLRNIL